MDAEVITKICRTCKIEKLGTDFYKSKTGKDNLRNDCKSCVSDYSKKYSSENKEKIANYKKKYRSENKEKIANWKKKYRSENKEKIADGNRKYEAKNKEKIAIFKKRYRAKNKEKIANFKKKYFAKNIEMYKGYNRIKRLELRESYIRELIIQSNPTLAQAPIPQSLINLKREEIRIKRLIKEMTQ